MTNLDIRTLTRACVGAPVSTIAEMLRYFSESDREELASYFGGTSEPDDLAWRLSYNNEDPQKAYAS